MLQQVLADCERELGRTDRLTMHVRPDLGMSYNSAGRRREERALLKEHLAALGELEAAVAAEYEAAEPTARAR
jgi:hypothetical protein